MALLHVAFQEGFANDSVVARVNGVEHFHKENVKTRTQIGYADSFEATVEESSVKLEVSLPSKNLSETFLLPVSAGSYVGISIRDGKIIHRISEQPFGYL